MTVISRPVFILSFLSVSEADAYMPCAEYYHGYQQKRVRAVYCKEKKGGYRECCSCNRDSQKIDVKICHLPVWVTLYKV